MTIGGDQVDVNQESLYEVTYSATDMAGNAATPLNREVKEPEMKFESRGPKSNRGYILYCNEVGKEDELEEEWMEMHLELVCDILENVEIEGLKIIKKTDEFD